MKKIFVVFVAFTLSMHLLLNLPLNALGSGGTIYSVAYIYSDELDTAQKFRSLLLSYGIAVDLVSNASAETWDYSPYGLIIVGPETGDSSVWNPSTVPSAINATGKPILGLGEGGYAFFGKLSLSIGYPKGGHETANGTHVVNSSHTIFNQPLSITVPPDSTLQLYNTSIATVVIYLATVGPTITVLGQKIESSVYYNILQEKSRYTLWGFSASPDYLTQTGKSLFVNLVFWLLGWQAPGSNSAAFVYSTKLDVAQSFETLLEANGITVDLVPKTDAETWNYSSYGLIIIGDDTAFGSDWIPESAVLAINATGKPILGLCRGGSSFFQELGLFVCWGQSAVDSDNCTYVVYPEHQVFNFPNPISIPPSRIIQLYTNSVYIVETWMPSPQPGVNPLGRDVGQANYYLILQEDARYVFWGFSDAPANMTQTGKDLFVNIAFWMMGNVLPEFPIAAILPLIMAFSVAAVATAKRKLKI
ncbi:MAG: hypothetical protein QW840_02315 [Candidatus Bathyarchaeia archaeon]